MRVLHTECYNYSSLAIKSLKKYCELNCLNINNNSEFKNHLIKENYNAIFCKIGLKISKDIISLQPDLKYIITPTTGLNHIDQKYAYEKKIEIISLKGESDFLKKIQSTAELTWGILLMLVRKLNSASIDVK